MKSNSLSKASVSYLWDFLLYSSLGCISYFLLVNYTDIPVRHQNRLINPEGILAAIILFNGVGISMKYINLKISETYPVFLKRRKMLLLFLAVTAVALLGSNYLLSAFAKIVIGSPFPFRMNSKGLSWLLGIWLVELVIVSQFMVNQFYKNLISLYKRSKELEENNLRAQYTALQNQLNPHFLFNSLNTLISEIEYNPMNAIQFTRYLADTYRYILHCQDKQSVSLEEELEFVETYTRIQNVRLGDCLHLQNRIPPEMLKKRLPPLTLQLLIENVIKHNTVCFGKPLNVDIYPEQDNENDWVCVSNPIRPKQGVVPSGKGLNNLSQRYQLLCNKEIIISNKEQIFTVKVPLLYE